jgi:hypothetical protein
MKRCNEQADISMAHIYNIMVISRPNLPSHYHICINKVLYKENYLLTNCVYGFSKVECIDHSGKSSLY